MKKKNNKVFKLSKMVRGWFIGNFSPTVKKTKLFEVAIQNYSKGDFEPSHHHKKACEITVIAKGSAKMNNKIYNEGDIIFIKPKKSTNFKALTKVMTVVVKIPSVKGDKYLD